VGNANNGVRVLANNCHFFSRISFPQLWIWLSRPCEGTENSTDVKLQFGRSMTVDCAEDVLKLMLRLLSDETMPLACSLLLWDGLALDCIHIQNNITI
jgi:hypothetical protein